MSGNEVTLIIDGREVKATEGEMLHDAAKRGDVEIPVFCYEPKLGEPVGACRMCLVEVEGIPKLQTSCSTPVRDGMVVHTRTDQVKHAQSAVVEFLLVNHPLDCPVCDKGGECPLQDISMGWGPGKSRMIDDKRHFEKPIELSPLVAIDRERCILCYRCVRFSQEVAEDEQLQLLDRGDRTFVGTFDDRPYIAPFHGNITDLCPVGALTSYTYRFRARPWDIEQAGSVCTLCPSQCNVSFTVRDEQVKRVIARDNADVDDGWLCDRGRYGFEMFGAEERVAEPRLKGGAAADWQAAIAGAAEGLKAAGEGRVAAIVGDASNEEGYLVQRIVREALGSPHVDSRVSRGPGREALLRLSRPELSAKVRDIDDAGAVLVLGTDPLHSSPILDLRIRKGMRRNGVRLAVATDRPTPLDGGAEAIARYAPGEATSFLSEPGRRTTRRQRPLPGPPPNTQRRRRVRRRARRRSPRRCVPPSRVVIVWGERIGRRAGCDRGPARRRRRARARRQGGRGPAGSAGARQRPRPARGRLPPRRRPGADRGGRGHGHRGDPRRPDGRRDQVAGAVRSRSAPGLPGYGRMEIGSRRRRPHRHLLDLRERDHSDLGRRLPARDSRRERRHRDAPGRALAEGPSFGSSSRRHPPELGRPR